MLTGLRGRLEAADRRNLIRVMPAKGADMSISASADVLVIGGGVIGLSIAWRAAQRGMRVTVADPAPGSGASNAAAGMITPISEAAYAERELFRLGRESQRRYPEFAAELTRLTGEPTGYRQAGTLQVAYDADDLAVLGEYQALQESFGVPARRLLDPAIRGGLLAAEDASVDPRLLTRALLAAASKAGAEIIRQPAAEILIAGSARASAAQASAPWAGGTRASAGRAGAAEAGAAEAGAAEAGAAEASGARASAARASAARASAARASGARASGARASGARAGAGRAGAARAGAGRAAGALLGDGTQVLAPRVVLAAGWSSDSIAGLPAGTVPPVRPVKGQILRLRSGPPGLLARSVRGIVRGSSVYLVPRESGELVIGATQEELGADTRVTAGGVWELLRDARTIVPGITELELAEAVAGLRPGTPDNAPVLGPSALPGLVLATGHFRAGVLLAPVTADVITDYLATRRMPDLAAAFTPGRFARPTGPPAPGRARGNELPRAARRNTADEGARP